MAKYCNERVCVTVCLCVCVCVCLVKVVYDNSDNKLKYDNDESISLPKIYSIFTKFLCALPIAVARSSSSGVTQSQGEGAVLGVFFPTDNALYSMAFDDSVCQESVNSTRQISWRRRCGLSDVDCTARAKTDIYDCFV